MYIISIYCTHVGLCVYSYIHTHTTCTAASPKHSREASVLWNLVRLYSSSHSNTRLYVASLYLCLHTVMKVVSRVPSWCSRPLKTLQRSSETAALSDFPEQLGIEVLHLPRLQVAEPEAHAAVREAVLQGLQLAFRKQEQRGQARGLGQPHRCGRAVGVVQHHHLRRVVPEHHGDVHTRGGVQLEASWHRVAPLKRQVT